MSDYDFTEGTELPEVIEGVIEVVVGALPTLAFYEGDLDDENGGLINLDEDSAVERLQSIAARDLAILTALLELGLDRAQTEARRRRRSELAHAG